MQILPHETLIKIYLRRTNIYTTSIKQLLIKYLVYLKADKFIMNIIIYK